MYLTKPQQQSLYKAWRRAELSDIYAGLPYMRFRRTVQPTFGCDGAVIVAWCGMVLCIERDGYTHT